MKVYVKIPVEKELPESLGKYITDKGELEYNYGDKWWIDKLYGFVNISWWLKEIDLSELMEEFMVWRDKNYSVAQWHSRLINQFLTEKGYIQL